MLEKSSNISVKIDTRSVEAIEKALSAGAKIEIQPTRDGFRVYSIKRKEIAQINNTT
jgi:hypothetical protein